MTNILTTGVQWRLVCSTLRHGYLPGRVELFSICSSPKFFFFFQCPRYVGKIAELSSNSSNREWEWDCSDQENGAFDEVDWDAYNCVWRELKQKNVATRSKIYTLHLSCQKTMQGDKILYQNASLFSMCSGFNYLPRAHDGSATTISWYFCPLNPKYS